MTNHPEEDPFTFSAHGQERLIEIGMEMWLVGATALMRDWWRFSGCELYFGPLESPQRDGRKPKGYYYRIARLK